MSGWKKIATSCFIASYMCYLSWGVMAHAMKVGLCGNTLSYFVVWDMFCGWTAWDARTHVIAQDTSGQFYELREPWGEFHPFGHVARIHYDNTSHLLPKHIKNVLAKTVHEEIERVYVVEEVWPKQYNLPPRLFEHYFARPNDKLSYFHLRAICAGDGSPMTINPDWHSQQKLNAVYDNPRLRRQSKQATGTFNTLYNPRQSAMADALSAGGGNMTTN